jgi:hypothetical protein
MLATSRRPGTVDITVSSKRLPTRYEARSYPHDDMDGDGRIELYATPICYVYIDGFDRDGKAVRREWNALRFMPFYNKRSDPSEEYTQLGWANSGLRYVGRQPVPDYLPDYEVHNRYSEYGGALVVRGSFFIHAGPSEISEFGWGAAGCVEVIGNFDKFKGDILELAGSAEPDLDKGIGALVAARKLFVQYEQAQSPNLQAAFTRQVAGEEKTDTHREPTTGSAEPVQ